MSISTEGNDTDIPDSKRPNIEYGVLYSMIFYSVIAMLTMPFKKHPFYNLGLSFKAE
jgi:hypothetical protein